MNLRLSEQTLENVASALRPVHVTLRFVAWAVLLIGMFWTLGVKTVAPGEMGIRLQGNRVSGIFGDGSHYSLWLLHRWQTLPQGRQYVGFTGNDRIVVPVAARKAVHIEAWLPFRLTERGLHLLFERGLQQDPAGYVRATAQPLLQQLLAGHSLAQLHQPSIRRELTTRFAAQIHQNGRLEGFDVDDLVLGEVELTPGPAPYDKALRQARTQLQCLLSQATKPRHRKTNPAPRSDCVASEPKR